MIINSDPSKPNQYITNNTIDLVLFMGQSNMAGRGTSIEAPLVPKDYGYEFRSISDPSKLHNISEPFGVNENNLNGINEPGMKTGSLVSSFVNAYYKTTNIPIVGVSASKGGSSISQWQPNGIFLLDSINRLNKAREFLLNNKYNIRRTFMVWCQGETDGDNNMSEIEYKSKLKAMIDTMMKNDVETCFLIRIGNHRDNPMQYQHIINAQTNFCETNDNTILVATQFDKMAKLGLMKDSFHYQQAAYNEVGTEAGINTANYIQMY